MTSQMLPSYLTSYLKKFFIDKWELELSVNKKFNNIIIVPAIQEHENIIHLIKSILSSNRTYFNETLLLFVINNPENISHKIKKENQKTIEFLRKIIAKGENEISDEIFKANLNIGLVDASSRGYELPDKDAGVGLARKIGMDLALRVFDYNNNWKKILISLDADCTIEKNYLTEIVEAFNEQKINAATVYYEHPLPENTNQRKAIIMYELYLRYYVIGLRYAKSPYAYHTIGSTIVCDAEYYCKAGGMNKRKAGEDFYFLEKLAKLTPIYKINTTTVYPSARSSQRVPFGTGQSILRFLDESQEELLVYNPLCFDILKDWLELFYEETIRDKNYYLKEAKKIHIKLKEFLDANNFAEAWKSILKNSKTEEQIKKQKSYWFDAFRTLKLIHYLRDNAFPQVNIFFAIDEMLKRLSIQPLNNTNAIESYLFAMRDIDKK